MITPQELATRCLSMKTGQTLLAAPDNTEHTHAICKISCATHLGFRTWLFVNAEGKTTTVTALPSDAEENVLDKLSLACFAIPGRNVNVLQPVQGAKAKRALRNALFSNEDGKGFPRCPVSGYFRNEGASWVAFDNTSHDCFVEEFASEMEAVIYLLYDFSSVKEVMDFLQR